MIIESILEFVQQLSTEKNQVSKATKDLSSWQLLVNDIPLKIKERASLSDDYLVTGSIGKGLISETPWIGVFDKNITTSAQNGFYIVYLFKSDLSGFYLSLNQGWTQYDKKYSLNEAKEAIKLNALKAQSLLRGTSSFSFDPVDLKAFKTLAKGYELGNICSKYYSIDNLPSEIQFIDDLRNLIGVYRELKGLVGNDILEIENNLSEDEYQSSSQKGRIKLIADGPIKRKEKNTGLSKSSSWSRNPDLSYTALHHAGFVCENDSSHQTFISARNNHNFMEAHHLIPIEYQKSFENSLDVPENIISLCPNCHRAIHLSKIETKKEIIEKFYSQRSKKLAERGLIITITQLLEYY
jgi:5-methylcytosine-specific restriction protein A